MKVQVQRLNNPQNGKETGAILRAVVEQKISQSEKEEIERKLQLFAEQKVYPGKGLQFYSIHIRPDPTATIIAMKDVDKLPDESAEIDVE